ncbi:NADP-dependent oxidoreductase [Paraburkholderia caffeinilytica]|uniref:Oxidoreductase n=1 Tax=Paraburkholderia caffeinilytica TaxID=1761016 RepID=A0ABQ1N7D7_9BURK|nr:aldo/keto reductase [Paraburkholderia caffeinilytica]AXL49111.1 NADP-dependent oxidoreductase [Paraburkholderia caffeinilytica]GGC57001.1 oxidoreductase [Paraburkholderia caffeinilytica]CAB3807324.1 1-deoxyxylulose-5-phosphate synthase YajO [Paraburkholderia caffeinilytica]
MDYRYLGRSALKVSPLCLGAMMFGGETDEASSKRIIDKAYDQGVNFIDTADVYHAGRSEEIVGRAIAERRDNWVVATKFGFPSAPAPNQQGQSRKWIIQSVEASLKRLGTDYIDILYFHRALADAPLEEGVRAIGDLIRQGKVRYFGVSNFPGWRIAEVARLADQLGIDRPVASEPLYNIVDRTAEVEQLPAAHHYGLGVVSYSPLARGVLSGKYAVDAAPPADSRAGRGDPRIQQTEWRPESLRIAQAIAGHAAERGTTSIAFALAWVLKNRSVSSTIAGPRTEAQWDSYVDALRLQLGPDDEKLVDSLVAPGHASTPGYTDPGYPVEGRRVA